MKLPKAHQDFKNKYGFVKHPNFEAFLEWSSKNTFSLKTLFPTIKKEEMHHIDLSTTTNFIGGIEEFNNIPFFQTKIEALQKQVPNKIITGGYLEKRALYTSDLYVREINGKTDRRNTHLGVDFWLPENTPVHAILDGEVVGIDNNNEHKGYGGVIILKHTLANFNFYTLYGHNTIASVFQHKIGDFIKKDQQIAILANAKENGDWATHLHFQVMLDLLDFKNDFPGVAFESEVDIWKTICPNPNLLFQ
ncbi:peptidoglycan DD-metalloendopeptidase family protein [uncultured Polaribacter sp.]|uniref:peptidoglycan DD-metalloendopeptidase family protein n=1 Tax=uncultured Polaribacter sp. TaxID=174711 RepID=UPI002610F941|nr:peptidoglycan DD-metalloendopeptidase family protein [uncultured Polaribacter sp.]